MNLIVGKALVSKLFLYIFLNDISNQIFRTFTHRFKIKKIMYLSEKIFQFIVQIFNLL